MVETCRVLLNAKADVNAQDVDEETATLYAAKLRCPELTTLLLASRPAIEHVNIHGETAPQVCAKARDAELFKKFCEHDATEALLA